MTMKGLEPNFSRQHLEPPNYGSPYKKPKVAQLVKKFPQVALCSPHW